MQADKTTDYPYIRLWGFHIMGSDAYYVLDQVERARADKAPPNAVSFSKEENRWHTTDDIHSDTTRARMGLLPRYSNVSVPICPKCHRENRLVLVPGGPAVKCTRDAGGCGEVFPGSDLYRFYMVERPPEEWKFDPETRISWKEGKVVVEKPT